MKKRFLFVLLSLLCLVVLVAAIPAAAVGTPGTTIMGHNLELNSSVSIIYYVDFQNAPSGAETGVLVWTNSQESYVYGEEEAKLESIGINYGYETFSFPGVSSKMMTQDIYAVSYIKKGDDITYSSLDKYSVLQYAYNKKGDTTHIGGTKMLGELLIDMLNYGTTAQQYFGYKTNRLANATYYQIRVEGGTLPDGTTKGLYKKGESVTLTANLEGFRSWKNTANQIVSDEATVTFTVSNAETYMATSDGGETSEPIIYSDGLEFTSNGDGTCYVSGIGTCTDTDLRIPPLSPGGDAVTSIGYQAFRADSSLTSVTIPDSVTGIGLNAFRGCSSLTGITIPDSVTSIGDYAFSGCSKLVEITIGNGITSIGNSAFLGCSSLTSITIPDSVTSIGNSAFRYCYKLADVTIGDGVTSIGPFAFLECRALASITLPSGITSIEESTFQRTPLTSISIPDGATSIERQAFQECDSLVSITIPTSVTWLGMDPFHNSFSLTTILYQGTTAQWKAISKHYSWNEQTGNFTIYCTDGTLSKYD